MKIAMYPGGLKLSRVWLTSCSAPSRTSLRLLGPQKVFSEHLGPQRGV